MSRRQISPLYLRIEDIPEYQGLNASDRARVEALAAPLRAASTTAALIDRDAVWAAKRAALDATRQAFDICGARTSFRTFPLEAMYRDARTLTLHVRDDVQMRELGRGLLRDGSSVKAALDTSVLPSRNA